MLKRKSKRVLSIVLAVAMIVGLFPIAAFADETIKTVANADELSKALSENSTTTIVLAQDINVTSQLNVSGTHILDLGTRELSSTSSSSAIKVAKDASLTVSNGTIDYEAGVSTSPGTPAAIVGDVSSTITIENDTVILSSKAGVIGGLDPSNQDCEATLNIYGTINCEHVGVWSQGGKNSINLNGATVNSKYFGVTQNGSAGGSTILIKNSSVTDNLENGAGVYISANKNLEQHKMTIENSKITGNTAVEVKFTDVTISGNETKLVATNETAEYIPAGNGSTTNGYAFVLSHNGTKPNPDAARGSITILGGAFDGKIDIINASEGAAPAESSITISGGNFANVPDKDTLTKFIVPGNALDTNGNVTVASDAEAQIDGLGYPTLADAVAAAEAGDTITLVNDVVLDGTEKGDTEGLLTITKDITIVGNGHKITATNVNFDTDGKGPSMINIQNNADVTLDHVVIDGGAKTKHGININNAGTVTLNDVTVKNNRWYAVMDNESALVLKGLSTSGNQWGINIDNKAGAASLIVNDATITEASSIVYDANDGAKIGSTIINGGCFQYIISNNAKATLDGALTINGGTFATGELPTSAINIADHLAPGLEFNPVTGQVYKEPEYTGKYSYEIFTKVGENGTISVDRYATEGDDVTITVSPDEAYLLDELTVTANGKEVEVKDNGDGTYTFKMPSADAKIVVTFAEDPDWEPAPEMPFTDVNEGDWFYDVVLYAYDNGLMTGVSATEFAPNQTTTRGMIVSMLARLEGVTSAEDAGFADVAANDWYATAVNWAASVGVVNGYEDNTFRPNAPITREQMAAILYNYADYKGYDVSARADLSDYADAASISSWAEDVLAWANAEGLINGMTATTIDPQGATTRAQTAAMFERFLTAHEA